jgi:predicted DNA-binding protein with PD1-like motif
VGACREATLEYFDADRQRYEDIPAVGGHVKRLIVWPTLEVIVTESPAYLRKRVDEETGLALIDPS